MDQTSLNRNRLAILASDWAAQTAINNYAVDPSKVKVVPYGANIEHDKSLDDMRQIIDSRPSDKCKLLFLGIDWFRKGGDIAFQVAKILNESGLPTELVVVGCDPVLDGSLPDFVKPMGFISKSTKQDFNRLAKLLAASHFLIVPSMAECYGIVFCEANSFGVPSISTNVGGIPTIIKDNINGKKFSKDAATSEYCAYISNLFSDYVQYKKLALSSFNEYSTRLNWSVPSSQTVRKLLEDIG